MVLSTLSYIMLSICETALSLKECIFTYLRSKIESWSSWSTDKDIGKWEYIMHYRTGRNILKTSDDSTSLPFVFE